jgi:hypothetical protein
MGPVVLYPARQLAVVGHHGRAVGIRAQPIADRLDRDPAVHAAAGLIADGLAEQAGAEKDKADAGLT